MDNSHKPDDKNVYFEDGQMPVPLTISIDPKTGHYRINIIYDEDRAEFVTFLRQVGLNALRRMRAKQKHW